MLGTRVRRAGLVIVGHALDKGVAPSRGLAPSTRGRGATYQLRSPRISRLLCVTRERGTALAVSREEAQHASLSRVRRASLIVVGLSTMQGHCCVRGLSPSARGRGATYQLRPPRISRLLRNTRERATAFAVYREEAQHASLLRARAVPGWVWSADALG